MEQYIPKSALLAKIEKIREYANENWDIEEVKGIDKFIDKLESYINTLEVKEVDLDKEAERFVQTKEFIESTESPVILVAKHFFELGIKAQKGE